MSGRIRGGHSPNMFCVPSLWDCTVWNHSLPTNELVGYDVLSWLRHLLNSPPVPLSIHCVHKEGERMKYNLESGKAL